MAILLVLLLIAALALVVAVGTRAVRVVAEPVAAWPGPAIVVVEGSSWERTAWIAGRLAAEAIGMAASGAPVAAMIGREAADGTRTLATVVTKAFEDGVRAGKVMLRDNPEQMVRAALAFDGPFTFRDGKHTNAIFIEARDYTSTTHFRLAVPYREATMPRGFAVFRPKFRAVPKADLEPVLRAFWAGVGSLEKAAAVWTAHIDQSR